MRRTAIFAGFIILWGLCLRPTAAQADVVVPEAKVHAVVADYVRGLLSNFEGEVEVTVRYRGDLRVEGTGAVHLRARSAQTRGSARTVPVTLEVFRGPVVVREYLLSARVRYFDQVVVAAHPIHRRQPITAGSVTVERREVTTILGRYLRDVSELEGMRARMRIGFGRPIDPRYVERTPVVERGDRVRIQVEVGGVTGSAEGLATESGAVGDRIGIQNLSSREKLTAQVVAAGLVRVFF